MEELKNKPLSFNRDAHTVQWEDSARSGEIHVMGFAKASQRSCWSLKEWSEGRNGRRG